MPAASSEGGWRGFPEERRATNTFAADPAAAAGPFLRGGSQDRRRLQFEGMFETPQSQKMRRKKAREATFVSFHLGRLGINSPSSTR